MKALILIGGYGTRLRPLTLSIPKPIVEFANRPMLLHQIEALLEIIKDRNVRLIFSYEEEALDTAGPLIQASPFLLNGGGPFFVLNSDIICNYPFKKMIDFHLSHKHEGTMAVTKVEEPSKYGVVVFNNKTGLVQRFVEKPMDFVTNRINAGLYIFETSVLDRIKENCYSMETNIFPSMVTDSELYCIEFSGYWMDIGQPADYLNGLRMHLSYLFESKSPLLSVQPSFIGNVLVDSTAKIGSNCRIGPNVTIGSNVLIEDGVCIRNSAIFPNSIIRCHAWMENCIVGWKSVVGRWVRMENVTVLGEDVTVKDELFLNGTLVLPNNCITQSVPDPNIIM